MPKLDVSKGKLAKITMALEDTQVAFRVEVEKLAERARAEIMPYFKEHDLDFMAGNGTWFISHSRKGAVTDDELPQNIRALLSLEVAHADYLGFYIRDIKRGEW